MTLVLMEGFDNNTATSLAVKQNRTLSLGTSGGFEAGRFGGQAARCQTGAGGGGPNVTFTLPSTYATLITGFAFKPGTANTAFLELLTSGGTLLAYLQINASRFIEVRNVGNTLIATGTTALTLGNYYYVELKLFVNGASGTCEVHLNGVSEIASTTGNFGSTNIGKVYLGWSSATNTTCTYDDVYACDTSGSHNNSFLGDVRVVTVYPDGDGAHTQWTATGGGSHYTQVNETTPDGDTTYVSDSTPGDIDTYTVTDIDGGASVFGVQTNLYARKDDANTRQIAPLIRQSSTDYVGTTVTLGSSYVGYVQLYDQDPTSTNWTAANVNADEFGVKEIA